MASTVQVYKNGILLGAGSAEAASVTISSFTAEAGRVTGSGRNVQLMITQAGTHLGRTWNSRVVTDGGTSLTLKEPCPFVGA